MVSKRGILLWFWCYAPAFGWPQARFARPRSLFVDSSTPTQSLQYRQGSASEDDYSSPKILFRAVLPQVADTSTGLDELNGSDIISNPENSADGKYSSQELEESINSDNQLDTESLPDVESSFVRQERSQFAKDLEKKLKPKQRQVETQRNLMAYRFKLEIKDRFQRVRPNGETALVSDITSQQHESVTSSDPERDDGPTVSNSVDVTNFDTSSSSRDSLFRRDIVGRWSAVEFDDRVKSKVNATENFEVENSNDKFLKDVMKHRVSLEEDSSESESTLSASSSEKASIETIETKVISPANEVPFFVESGVISGDDSSEHLASMDANSSDTVLLDDLLPRDEVQENKNPIFRWPNPSKFFDDMKNQMELEPINNVSTGAFKGAAMMGLVLATVGSGGLHLVAGGSAAALTSFLALTKGTPGEVVRVTGSSLWDIAVSTAEATKARHSSRKRRESYIEQNENTTKADDFVDRQSTVEQYGTASSAEIINQVQFRRQLMLHRFALEEKGRKAAAEAIESETLVPFFLGDGYYENVSGIPPLHRPALSLLSTVSDGQESSNQPEAPKRTPYFPLTFARLKERLQLQRQVISLEAELDVDDDTIKGAAISGLVLATIGSGGLNFPLSVSVAAVTSCLAMTKGAAGEVSRAMGDYAWEVVLSAREVFTPERQHVLKKDFAEGWLQFGLTLMEGTVSVANSTKEAVSDYEKRMAKLENQRKMEILKLQRSAKQDMFLRSMMKRRLSLEKAEIVRKEQKRFQQAIIRRQQRDQVQVTARRGLMSYRFGLESAQRAKHAEESKKAQVLAERAELERMMVKSRQEMMRYRFVIECEQRAKRVEELEKAQFLAEKAERERMTVKTRQEVMQYRFMLEGEQLAKRAESIFLVEQAERERIAVKTRQEMMSYRLNLEGGQRFKRANEIKKVRFLSEKTKRERTMAKTRQEMMSYRFILEGEERVKRGKEMKKVDLVAEKAERERSTVQSQREMMLYRFVLEQEQRAKHVEALKKVQKMTSVPNVNEEDGNTAALLLARRTKVLSKSPRCAVTKLATALVLSYVGFLYNPRPPPSLYNPDSIRVREPYTFPVYQFELP